MLRFVGNGDQKNFTKNPRYFSMQNSPANTKKIFTKCFWRVGKSGNTKDPPQEVQQDDLSLSLKAKNLESVLLAEPQLAAMFPCRTLTRSAKVLIFAVGVECGENRGRTGGEPGENRGRPKEPGENPGHLGREPGENRGLLVFIYKEYRGRSGGFGTRTGGEPRGGNFFATRDPTRDLKINEQDRPCKLVSKGILPNPPTCRT